MIDIAFYVCVRLARWLQTTYLARQYGAEIVVPTALLALGFVAVTGVVIAGFIVGELPQKQAPDPWQR